MPGKQSILLAACDATLADIYGRRFQRAGWEVEVVAGVREAEHLAVQMRPSIVLLDSSCAVHIDEEIRRMRTLPTMLRTKIVLLANHATQAQIHAALQAGAAEYLLAHHVVPAEAVEKMQRLLTV